eukprot:3982046-Pleurochrysis_carterae.AAC.1
MTKLCSRLIILTPGLKILPFSNLGSRVRQLSWVPKPRPIPEDPPTRQGTSANLRVCAGVPGVPEYFGTLPSPPSNIF